jgi:hypothetical protein
MGRKALRNRVIYKARPLLHSFFVLGYEDDVHAQSALGNGGETLYEYTQPLELI